MKTLQLKRVTSEENITFGVLIYGGAPICVTLEPPWKDNKPSVSCIPVGVYVCRRVKSPKFGDTFEIADVPGRTHILFHKGNWAKDTYGCVILGSSFVGGSHTVGFTEEAMVVDSIYAFSGFMDFFKDDNEFKLDVI